MIYVLILTALPLALILLVTLMDSMGTSGRNSER